MTTQEMIDAIRKGDRLGHKAMQEIADRLAQLRAERDELLGAAKAVENLLYSEKLQVVKTVVPLAVYNVNTGKHGGRHGN